MKGLYIWSSGGVPELLDDKGRSSSREVKMGKLEGHCRSCGKMAILGDGLCVKCWDKADSYHEDEKAASLEGANRYYVKRDGKFVETTRQEFVGVVSGVTYHK